MVQVVGLVLDQLGGIHPEGLGELADRPSLGRNLFVGLQVEYRRGADAGQERP
jgi:hypothetical protein